MIAKPNKQNFKLFEFDINNQIETNDRPISRLNKPAKFFTRNSDLVNQINFSNNLQKNQILTLPINIKTDSFQFKQIDRNILLHKIIHNQLKTEKCRNCGINFAGKRCLNCEYSNSNNLVWLTNLSRLNKNELARKVSSSNSVYRSNSASSCRTTSSKKSADSTFEKLPKQEAFYKIWKKMSNTQKQNVITKLKDNPNLESASTSHLNELIKVNCIKLVRANSDYGFCYSDSYKYEKEDKDYINYVPILKKYGL